MYTAIAYWEIIAQQVIATLASPVIACVMLWDKGLGRVLRCALSTNAVDFITSVVA